MLMTVISELGAVISELKTVFRTAGDDDGPGRRHDRHLCHALPTNRNTHYNINIRLNEYY